MLPPSSLQGIASAHSRLLREIKRSLSDLCVGANIEMRFVEYTDFDTNTVVRAQFAELAPEGPGSKSKTARIATVGSSGDMQTDVDVLNQLMYIKLKVCNFSAPPPFHPHACVFPFFFLPPQHTHTCANSKCVCALDHPLPMITAVQITSRAFSITSRTSVIKLCARPTRPAASHIRCQRSEDCTLIRKRCTPSSVLRPQTLAKVF